MKYYSTQRPPGLGTFPKPKGNRVLEIEAFDRREYVEEIGREAWGWIDYAQELTDQEAAAYELVKGKKRISL